MFQDRHHRLTTVVLSEKKSPRYPFNHPSEKAWNYHRTVPPSLIAEAVLGCNYNAEII